MILVVGATGLLGSEVCRQLRAAGRPVRALIRRTSDPGKVENLRALGCELATGDLKDSGSIQSAVAGAEAIVSTASSTLSRQPGDSIAAVDLAGQLAVCSAARNGGVRRLVYVSFRDDPAVRYPLTEAKRAVEQAAADLDFTSVQASWFMEVWLSPALGFDYAQGKVRIYGEGLQPISWVSYRDVAAFCTAAVLQQAPRHRILQAGGPEALTPLEVVKIFEQESGRSFEVQAVPESALRAQLQSATDPLQKSFAGLMLQYAHGDAIDMSETSRQFPVRLTSVREYARGVLGAKTAST